MSMLEPAVNVPARPILVPVWGDKPVMRVGFRSPKPSCYMADPTYIHEPKPIVWRIKHPYWIVRQDEQGAVVMAYVPIDEYGVEYFWPEATDITVFEEEVSHYQFSVAFPKPNWLDSVQSAPAPELTPGAYVIVNTLTEDAIVGSTEDLEYDVKYNIVRLMYGTHTDRPMQEAFTIPDVVTSFEYRTKDLDSAIVMEQRLREQHFGEDPDIIATIND